MKNLIFHSGPDALKTCKNYARYLFDDKLLELFSWKGTLTKDAFMNLKNINSFICEAVRKVYKNYTNHMHAQEYQVYLKQSKFRNKRKL